MRAWGERQTGSKTGLALSVGAVVAIAIGWLAYAAPLTKDEAYNRVYYGGFSAAKILQHYDLPNNHLLDTVFESWLPQGMIAWNPWTLRVIGVAAGVALTLVVLLLAARRGSLILALCLFGGSPLLVTYLFVSRGYGLSALLVVLSIVVPASLGGRLGRMRILPGAVLLALGIWPLPTNLWLAPGWLLGVLALWGLPEALLAIAVLGPLLIVEYYPIKDDVRFVAHLANGAPSAGDFLGDLVHGASIVPACFLVALALLLIAVVRARWPPSLAVLHSSDRSTQAAVWCALTSCSWFAVMIVVHAFGTELPYARNAVPALWLGVIAVVLGVPPTRLRTVATLILLVPLLVSVVLWGRAALGGDWKPVAGGIRSDVLNSSTPATIRDVSSIHADRVDCSSLDYPVCRLASSLLGRSGVAVRMRSGPYVRSLGCAIGSHEPPAPFQVIVYRRGTRLGELCH